MTVTFERPQTAAPEGSEDSKFSLSEEAAAHVAARAVVHCESMLSAIYGVELVESTCDRLSELVRSLTLNSGETLARLKELAATDPYANVREQDARVQRQRELEELIAGGKANSGELVPVFDVHILEVATTALALQAVSGNEWASEASDTLASHYVLDAWEMASGVREVPQLDVLVGPRALPGS